MSGSVVAAGLLAVVAVASGWAVFVVASMVRASFLLLLSFVAVAGLMLLLAAPYLGVATVFMMAVEMMAMALFMVMFMMNPAGLNPMRMVHQHGFALAAGIATFGALALAVLTAELPAHALDRARPVIHDLGVEMLGDSMLIFESAGVTLLAAMVGAVVLSSRSGRFGAADDGSRPPPLAVGGAPAGAVPQQRASGHGMHHGGMSHEGMSHEGMSHEDMSHEDMAHEDMAHAGDAHGDKEDRDAPHAGAGAGGGAGTAPRGRGA